jgi:HlyD family secretion protein
MKSWILWGLAALCTIALLIWIFAPKPALVDVASVTTGRFEVAIEEDGKTRLRDRYIVSTPVAGKVARIALMEGDLVRSGAQITTVSPTEPAFLDARTEDEMRARVGAIEAAWRRTSVNIERAKAALDQAANAMKRSQTLAQQGFISPTQNEAEELNLRLREKELESAKQDEHAARHELEQARAALRQYAKPASSNSARVWQVTAPINGKVLKVVQQSEGTVPVGTPLVELGDPSNLEVIADILTADATQLTAGMPVRINAGESNMRIEGRLRLVEPAAFTKVSALGVEEQRVRAVIDITSPPQQWRALGDGFRVDVRILIQTVESAVKVPASALFPLDSQFGAFVIEGGRARQRPVSIAARSSTEAWIKQGLEPGAQVIVYPPSSLKDGARVATRK